MHWVKKARYLGNHRFLLTFEDGSRKVADLEKHLDGEIFEPLKKEANFGKGKLNPDLGTVCWPNGADFSPDFLYEIGIEAALAEPARRARRGAQPRKAVKA